jgi:methionyl-tRNA formyltransferase
MRLIFMGTPDFSVPTLKALVDAGHEVVAVYTQPPRPAGRGKKDRKSAIHNAADRLGLTVLTPKSMKTDDAGVEFAALGVDVAVVVAYGQILPQAVLDAPKLGCINVHASLLPRWRGAAPIHRAIMAGDSATGVCIMQMEAGLDTGPVLARAETAIGDSDTTASLHDRLALMGAELIGDVLQDMAAGRTRPVVQEGEGVTYARKIEKAEARINWGVSAIDIDRQVRGLLPFPGAWFMLDGERIKLLAGTVCKVDEGEAVPGTLLDNVLQVACGEGSYQITRLQKAGKGPVDAEAFLRGKPVAAGVRLP